MPGPKTNEREGTRAVLKYSRTSAFKVRPVLDLIRDKPVGEARDILRLAERDAATVVGKLLDSAVANAENNDELDPEDLYVSACFADEATTMKRWRPRARGRATTIRKRTCHVTIIVSRLPDDRLGRLRAKREAEGAGRRARRVAAGRGGRRRDEQLPGTAPAPETEVEEVAESQVEGVIEAEATAGTVEAEIAATVEAPEAVEAPETEATESTAEGTEAAGEAEAAPEKEEDE